MLREDYSATFRAGRQSDYHRRSRQLRINAKSGRLAQHRTHYKPRSLHLRGERCSGFSLPRWNSGRRCADVAVFTWNEAAVRNDGEKSVAPSLIGSRVGRARLRRAEHNQRGGSTESRPTRASPYRQYAPATSAALISKVRFNARVPARAIRSRNLN